jgi:hypothetical protein
LASLPAVCPPCGRRLRLHPAAAVPTISTAWLQLIARQPTALVQCLRQEELKCIASRPYEAFSAILKYEKTPIKGASSGLGKVIS